MVCNMPDKGNIVFRAVCLVVTCRLVAAGISCLSNPCLHGICIDDINSTYSCYCVDGYTGVQCQTNWDECWSTPCQNGGTCVDGVASYNCSCSDGFIGDNCETNYNECESNPCFNNGTCIDMDNGYVCSCVPGFSGQHCELDVAVCNSTEEAHCYNGGECIEGTGFKFYCKCLPGWAGPKCEHQVDECESNPCQNGGICIDIHADYMCACPFGYTGKSCEIKIEFCDENSCSNNALCVVEDSFKVCYCVPDFHGERCELQYDECLLGPRCMNGGTCIDGVDNFTCSCPPRLTGSRCECLILEDGSFDCEYISPNSPTNSTQSITSTIINEETITTPTTFNFSDRSTITSYTTVTYGTQAHTFTTDGEQSIPTTISIIYDVTESTSSSTSTEDTTMKTTTGVTDETTTIKEVTEINEDQTKVTINSDSSKIETTTKCGENCKESTTTTILSTDGTTNGIIPVSSETTSKIISFTETTTEITAKTIEDTSPSTTDFTTDKMFTDVPTEHSILTSLFPPLATETLEVTTDIGLYTTARSECTNSVCNGHGTCINTPHGIQCHCNFNYAGKYCENKIFITSAAFSANSYLIHKLSNSTYINIAYDAKTLITNGQIMYVDIAKDVYMQLYMNSGLLKFKFSCGYQTMLLSELKTFVNRGYLMKIETRLDLYPKEHHCNASLRLNDTVAMSGGQIANITSLDYNATLYLGNAPRPSDPDMKPFIGCIKELEVNGQRRKVFEDASEGGEVQECVSLSCLSAPCYNGGSCADTRTSYTCACANGWTGDQCNQSICENNPCQAGGSCVKHPGTGFLCLCPYGKHGIFCEYNVEITRPSLAPINVGISSYLVYPLSASALNSDRFDLRLRFQTTDMDQIALLAFVGQNGHHDSRSQHLALTFVKGYIMLTWNMGSGPRRVFTPRAISARRGGHAVRVWRRGRAAGLSVDARLNASGNAPAPSHAPPRAHAMTLLPYLYIGGHPSEGFRELPHDLPLHSGWRGCVWDVAGQAAGRPPVGGRGVGQCAVAHCTASSCSAPHGVCIHSPATYGCICNEGWFGATCSVASNPCDRTSNPCQGQCVFAPGDSAHCDCPYGKSGINCDQDLVPTDVLFTGTRSYLKLPSRPVASVALSLEMELQPKRERGLLVFLHTEHFHCTLSLQGGLLEFRWTDKVSGVSSVVRSGVVVSSGEWHKVKAGRYGGRLYVWVDGALTTDPMLAHAYPHTATNATLLLGGAKDLSKLPFDAMSGPPESFFGCIRNFHMNNILLPLEKHNIIEGRNLGDCDGTPCGAEMCGGSACHVESGRGVCACASSGSAGRCRRHATCSREECSAPRGSCRGSHCVCAPGYAGLHCQDRIKITVAQFDGSALVSLYRPRHRVGVASEQREGNTTPNPAYLALNFTTAEPSGLLLWYSMDTDYMGIGLENGQLKLVWHFENTSYVNSTAKILDSDHRIHPQSVGLSRLIPRAGFLADGEWHALTLRLDDGNVTLIVDEVSVYVDETISIKRDYDHVGIFIGGIEDSSTAKNLFSTNFRGCIDQISTKEDSYITDYTKVYSENLKSCQLFPLT